MLSQSANIKATSLLRTSLTQQQKQDFETKGWFEVEGSSGRIYRVRGPNEHFCSVQRIGSLGLASRRRCFETSEKLPMADMLLAAKIWLERDEHEFFSMITSKRRLRSFFRYTTRRDMRSLAVSRRIEFG